MLWQLRLFPFVLFSSFNKHNNVLHYQSSGLSGIFQFKSLELDLYCRKCCIQCLFDTSNCYAHRQGDFKVQEDKKHRAKYQSLGDSEKKLQFFSARQIACRLLGSRGYLCQKVYVLFTFSLYCDKLVHPLSWYMQVFPSVEKQFLHLSLSEFIYVHLQIPLYFSSFNFQCWLPMEDCICSRIVPCPLWHRLRFWLYMHPKVQSFFSFCWICLWLIHMHLTRFC